MVKVYIVEDEKNLRDIYQAAFSNEGYDAYAAGDGQEAVDHMKEIMPDLVILDIMMPRKTGFEVLQFMKEDSGLKNIPVLALTNVLLDGQELVQKYGASRFLLKMDHTPKDIVEIGRSLMIKKEDDQPKI